MEKLKALLSDPRKARTAAGCLLVALATLGAVIYCIVYYARLGAVPEEPEASTSVPAESLPTTGVTLEEARQAALDDAGLTAAQVTFSVEALREEQGALMYQLNFRSWNSQFEYLIHAGTGAVYSRSKETRVVSPPAPAEPTPAPETAPPVEGASQPPETAQLSQPPESQPPASAQPEPSPSPAASAPSSLYIGMDRAKSIALEHASLTSGQARFTRLRMGRRDGQTVYQLRFRQGGTEYEYEIDASTGRVLSHQRNGEGG